MPAGMPVMAAGSAGRSWAREMPAVTWPGVAPSVLQYAKLHYARALGQRSGIFLLAVGDRWAWSLFAAGRCGQSQAARQGRDNVLGKED